MVISHLNFCPRARNCFFSAQLLVGLYFFTHFPTSNGHAAPVLVLGTCEEAQWHESVGLLSCRASGLTAGAGIEGGLGALSLHQKLQGTVKEENNIKSLPKRWLFLKQTLMQVLPVFSSAGLCWFFFSSSDEPSKGLLLSEWQPDVHCKLPI